MSGGLGSGKDSRMGRIDLIENELDECFATGGICRHGLPSDFAAVVFRATCLDVEVWQPVEDLERGCRRAEEFCSCAGPAVVYKWNSVFL